MNLLKRLILLPLTLISLTLIPLEVFSCDSTPVINISSPVDVGGCDFTVDIQMCAGDGGSLNGWSTDFAGGINITAFTPPSLTNGGDTAPGTLGGGVLTYTDPTATTADMFIDANTNTCLTYTVTVDSSPASVDVTFT